MVVEAQSCSGSCNSGAECNSAGDPDPGNMWSCYANSSGAYRCIQEATNSGGDRCYLTCGSGWKACGCNKAACNSTCLDKIPSSGGSATHTMLCDNCGQKFTCSCSKASSSTPTPAYTNTPTPTPTPTLTPTPLPLNCGQTGCNGRGCTPNNISCNNNVCQINCPNGDQRVGDCGCLPYCPTLGPSNFSYSQNSCTCLLYTSPSPRD